MSFNFPKCSLKAGSTVIAYRRDSGGESQNMDGQRAYQHAYFDHYGLEVLYEFEDAAVSGKSLKGRNEFQKLLDLVKSSEKPLADAVVFWDYRRLSRDYDTGQYVLAEFRIRGYTVISCSEEIPDTAEGKIIEALKLYTAEQENEAKSADIRRGLDFLFSLKDNDNKYLGLWPRRAPRFFKRIPHDLGQSHGLYTNDGQARIIGKLIPDYDTAPLVRQAFELRAQNWTYADIERATGLMGECTYQVLSMRYQRLFANPMYKGDVCYGGQWYYNYMEKIVSPELWAKAQAATTRGPAWNRGLASPRAGTSKFHLLSGLTFCALCGRRMTTRRANNTRNKTRYYICTTNQRLKWGQCPNRHVMRADILEPAVLAHVSRVYLSPDYVRQLINLVNDVLNQTDVVDQITNIEIELRPLYQSRNNLIDLGEQSGSQAVLDRLMAVEAEIEIKERKLSRLRQSERSYQPVRVDNNVVISFLDDAIDDLSGDVFRVKQKRLQHIIQKLDVTPNTATIYYNFPLPMSLYSHPLQSTLLKYMIYTIELPQRVVK